MRSKQQKQKMKTKSQDSLAEQIAALGRALAEINYALTFSEAEGAEDVSEAYSKLISDCEAAITITASCGRVYEQ